MSFEITEAFVGQFKSNVLMVAQQQVSRLRNTVRTTFVKGTVWFAEKIGAVTMQQRTSRHGDTPLISTPHERRRGTLTTWEWADLIDNADQVRTLIDPTNPYARAASMSAGRRFDQTIIDAMLGTAIIGGGAAGETTTNETWPVAGQQVAVGAANLTLAKIREASRILNANEVPDNDRFFVIEAQGLEALLGDSTITSADFNSVKLLMNGDIDSFMGFKWIRSELLLVTGTVVSGIAFQRDGLELGIGMDIKTRISERDDKSYSMQVYLSLDIGAVRIESERVVDVQYDRAV